MNIRNKRVTRKKHKINNEITSQKVRLIMDGSEPIVINTSEALRMSREDDMDLILINERQDPPIVRIEDYNKFLYNFEKLEKERKKNSSTSKLKEIQLSCEISDHDLETKSKKAKEFLSDGDKVKCLIQLKGRQKANPDRGHLVMLKFATLLEDNGIPENLPKYENGKWIMILRTKTKK